MTRLTWGDFGSRVFEAGVDQGVLYTSEGIGVPWNGLISVTESPSGAETESFYIDGIKYNSSATLKEFGGTIEAYTYPDEFLDYDGWEALDEGFSVDQQRRRTFGLSYRTMINTDIDGAEQHYKIHIVYNVLAQPSSVSYATMSEASDPASFSWTFSTTPVKSNTSLKLLPLSHVTIDSRKISATQKRFLEDTLYGNDVNPPRLMTLDDVLSLAYSPLTTWIINYDVVSGRSILTESADEVGDLIGKASEGVFNLTETTRLVPVGDTGTYLLEI